MDDRLNDQIFALPISTTQSAAPERHPAVNPNIPEVIITAEVPLTMWMTVMVAMMTVSGYIDSELTTRPLWREPTDEGSTGRTEVRRRSVEVPMRNEVNLGDRGEQYAYTSSYKYISCRR